MDTGYKTHGGGVDHRLAAIVLSMADEELGYHPLSLIISTATMPSYSLQKQHGHRKMYHKVKRGEGVDKTPVKTQACCGHLRGVSVVVIVQ